MAGGYRDFTAGETLTAANLENYCQNQSLMKFASSAARDTALSTVKEEGMPSVQVDSNSATFYSGSAWSTVGPLWGALTSYTPTLTQSGSVSLTVSFSAYQRIGRMVYWRFVLTVTGSGTASNDVVVSLPVTAAAGNDYSLVGTGLIYDSSVTTRYFGFAVTPTTTTLKFSAASTTTATQYYGANTFTAGLAVNDIVSGEIHYEAAADA